MYNRATSSPMAMPRMSTKTRLGSRRVSLGMKASGGGVQPDAQASRRGDGVLHHDPHPPHRRGVEAVEFPIADRSAAYQLTPGPPDAFRGSVHGVARDALPAADILLQPADADRHRPTQIQFGRRAVRAGDAPVEWPAVREILGEQRRQLRPLLRER